MSHEHALSIWKSVRSTFILFLVLVPMIIFANSLAGPGSTTDWRELVLPAAGMILFAGILAELGRRMINYFAGAAICHWRNTP